MVKRAYISFGANLGERYATWEKTLALLRASCGIRIVQLAEPIETDPIGPIQDQPKFLNSVIVVDTSLSPLTLLAQLLHIEQQLGRVRHERWGPRTVDLDILLYGDETVNLPELQIPHPEIGNRPFIKALLQKLDGAISLDENTLIRPSATFFLSREKDLGPLPAEGEGGVRVQP